MTSSRARLELSQEGHQRVQLIRLERGTERWHIIATVRNAPRQLIRVEPTTDGGKVRPALPTGTCNRVALVAALGLEELRTARSRAREPLSDPIW